MALWQGKKTRVTKFRGETGRIFVGGSNWWIRCYLLLARCVSASCNKSDKHFGWQL